MNNYNQFKTEKQEQISNLLNEIAFFAFSEKQLKDGLLKLNIKEEEAKNKLVSIGGGGCALKSEAYRLDELISYFDKQFNELMKDENFAVSAFTYELINHEFGYTGDAEPAIESLGYELEEIVNNPHLKKCFRKAIKKQPVEQ